MKKLLLVGVVGLSALLGGCSQSFIDYTMEPPRQAYPDQTPVVVNAGFGACKTSDIACLKSSSGQAGNRGSTRGNADAAK